MPCFIGVFKINFISQIKPKFLSFISLTICCVDKYRLHFYIALIRLFYINLVILFQLYKKYNNCLISFLSFCELILACTCDLFLFLIFSEQLILHFLNQTCLPHLFVHQVVQLFFNFLYCFDIVIRQLNNIHSLIINSINIS